MRALALLLTLVLVGCSSTAAEPVPAADAGADADAVLSADAVREDPAENCEEQHDKICAGGAECGVTWPCGGVLRSCGTCQGGAICGDNNRLHKCGSDCRGTNYDQACAEAGAPSAFGVALSCTSTPWRLSGQSVVARPGGRDGCTVVNGILCCPE